MRYHVEYCIGANTLGSRRNFSIFAHGRRDASQIALGRLRGLYPSFDFEITRCSRKAVVIVGLDRDRDLELTAYVNSIIEPED